jgi:hypothetical protein
VLELEKISTPSGGVDGIQLVGATVGAGVGENPVSQSGVHDM